MNLHSCSDSPFYQPLRLGEGLHQKAQLSPALRRFISSCWEVIIPIGIFDYTALPDTCQHLVSITAPGYRLGQLCLPSLFPLKRQITGPARIFGISFTPGMRQYFIPTQIKQPEQIQLWSDLSFPSLTQLERTLSDEPDFQQKVHLVEQWLLQQLERQKIRETQKQMQLRSAIQSIRLSHGQISVDEQWAREQGVSSRHLRRLFLHHLNMTPKQYADVIRFQSSVQLIAHQSIEALYQSHDYYDESHLIRQFKKFTGVTPRNFINLSVLSKPNSS